MCFGGGGGGDGGAAEREAERQRRIDDAVRNLNLQFGIYEDPIRQLDTGGGIAQVFRRAIRGNEPSYNAPPNREDYHLIEEHGGIGFDEAGYNEALRLYNQAQRDRQTATQNATARNALYGDTRKAVSDYYTNDLNQQRDVAGRQAKFGLARRGVRGGSSDLDTQTDMLRRYNEKLFDISNRADAASNSLRTQDEQTRLGLIDRINSGMSGSNAITSAIEQLRTNAGDVRANSTANTLGDVFGGYAAYNQGNATQQGQQRAYRDYYQIYNNPGSYSGRRYN